MYMSPSKTLIYCLDTLRIDKNTELYRKALELQKDAIEDSNEWISAMKIIANAYYSSLTSYSFSQSQLSDFLTLSAKGIEEKRMSSEIIKNLIFKMYRDILETYQEFSHSLKSDYPRIIVEIISIINQGMDTQGTKVSSNGIENYYQSRRQQGVMAVEEHKEVGKKPSTST